MRHFLTSTIGIATLLVALAAHAESDLSIPDKVRSNILKRYPQAHDMQAQHETHFGQKLLEVSFKDENDQEILNLFTAKGHLFTSELKIESLGELSASASTALKQEFPDYTLKKTELIVNPNGVGEEYEIYLHAKGVNWKITINEQGIVKDKQQLSP